MKQRSLYFAGGLILIVGIVAALILTQTSSPATELIGSGELSTVYTSTDELMETSDLVVIGVFKDKETIVEPVTPRDADVEPPYDPGHRDLLFSVTDVVKGKSAEQIWIAQRVSFLKDGVAAIENDSLLEPGERYILFLKSSTLQPDEFYWLTGATQGALKIVDGKVYSRNVLGDIPENVGPTVDGTALDQMVNTLK